MVALGVSTSALADKSRPEALLAYKPDVVEFYNYPSAALPAIAAFCDAYGIRPALHTPVPYDHPDPLSRFAPTGPDPAEAALARRLALATVQAAVALDAVHVVVHFPSPYSPYPRRGFADACDRFLEPVAEAGSRHGVRILVENLSPNPLLNTPADYRLLLDRYPDLGFCLDLGHAHLMPGTVGPADFVDALGPRIESAHLYNTSAATHRRRGHELVDPVQHPRDGYLDIEDVVGNLVRGARPRVMVMEHLPVPAARATAAAAWLRGLLLSEERRAAPPTRRA